MNRRSFLPFLSLLGLPFLSRSARAQVSIAPEPSVPKVYKAKLTQSGEDAPTADARMNTLDCDVAWVHWGTGEYIGGFSTQFGESAKVFCFAPVRDNAGDVTTGTASNFTMDGNAGSVMICAYGEGEDGLIGRREIEGSLFVSFEVYE